VYHPRKRAGFGFTDGEGCERCWSALKKLVPILRVSGVRLGLSISVFKGRRANLLHSPAPPTPISAGRSGISDG